MKPREREAAACAQARGGDRRSEAAPHASRPRRLSATLSGLVLCGGGYLTRPTLAGTRRGYQSSSE
jgi:hypothetical protein